MGFNFSKRTYVKPSGVLASCRYVLVGEQPGRIEVQQGEPFVGPSGSVLDNCLGAIGINRGECYITNVIKDLDLQLENYISFKKNQVVLSDDAQEYLLLLKDELSRANARVVVAIGNVALYALTQRVGITKWRGSLIESTLVPGKLVIPCVHPATVIPPKNVSTNRLLIMFDLQKARLVEEGKFALRERLIHTKPTFVEAIEYLRRVRESGLRYSFDIEVFNEELSCFAIAPTETEAMCVTLIADGVDLFTPEQELEIMRELARLIESTTPILGQNLTFDGAFLLSRYGICINPDHLDDTMIAQKITMSAYPKGLDFICSIHTTIPYYKDDGKKWFRMEGGSQENFWAYNATDAMACAEALPNQLTIIKQQGNEETYSETTKVVGPLIYMMNHGIAIDVEQMRRLNELFVTKIKELQSSLDALAGRPLNIGSNKQLTDYFYRTKGFMPYTNKKTKGESVDDKALTRLALKGSEEAKIIKQMRKLDKLRSTYLNVEKVDKDGRIRCSYDPVGTKFSRLSSSENIHGTGMNLQNWPHLLQLLMWVD